MKPKEFISKVLISNIGDIHKDYHYISFALMAVGIEFLGKCIGSEEKWDKGKPKNDFERAINHLNSFSKYRPYLDKYKIWDSLRNGMLHSFRPKSKLSFSSGNEMKHLSEFNDNGVDKINLKCEDLYKDFKAACEEVLSMKSFPSKKMDEILLNTPQNNISLDSSFSGTT